MNPFRKFKKITKITEVEPEPARCITVGSEDRLYSAGGEQGNAVVSHNSVAQRNVIITCIMRGMGGVHTGEPGAVEKYGTWKFLGVDLKKVELSAFRKYSAVVLGVATELEDALTVLRFGQQTMMKRYAEMEALGVNHFHDLPVAGESLMIMVDEAFTLLGSSGVKALSENTLIPLPTSNYVLLKDLEIGDVILDNYSNPTTVTDKYEPEEQGRFELSVTEDSSNISERLIAGAEHNWAAYFEHPNGEVEGPVIMSSEELYDYKQVQEDLPLEERITVKFKKYVHD